ncbi:hypothetical protein [Roseibium sp. RKSG952]|uniref:hypothetical protein n=1 Tax=Roseibium sp. RKSG952 TaxID=2529384 RepID=UPI0012BBFC93|nr:hypothetical protein [Roseibium sp. RKSG952]MTI03768.1 hypothetical protein [Roseibium sp. RKSG952]
MKQAVAGAFAIAISGIAPEPVQANDWDFVVAPYLWGPEFRTSLDIGPNPPVDGSKSIFDILNSAFLIAGEARKGRWAIGGEFNYLNLGDNVPIGPFNDLANWELDGIMMSLGASYTVFQGSQSRVEAMAALRHWDLDLSTTVARFTASTDQSWTDPLIGARYHRAINDRWNFSAMGNVGGFGVGSKFQWEALIQAGWKWTDTTHVVGGYRHLSVDFEGGQNVIDLTLTGPYVALAFNF